MQKIKSMLFLADQQETITASDFRKAPGEVLEQVSMGKHFTLTKNGKAIAEIYPAEKSALELGAEIRRLGLSGQHY
jgi:prevent-host-death family protein